MNQIAFLTGREPKLEAGVVMINDAVECSEPAVVVEATPQMSNG
jgi:hypothetical protein